MPAQTITVNRAQFSGILPSQGDTVTLSFVPARDSVLQHTAILCAETASMALVATRMNQAVEFAPLALADVRAALDAHTEDTLTLYADGDRLSFTASMPAPSPAEDNTEPVAIPHARNVTPMGVGSAYSTIAKALAVSAQCLGAPLHPLVDVTVDGYAITLVYNQRYMQVTIADDKTVVRVYTTAWADKREDKSVTFAPLKPSELFNLHRAMRAVGGKV